MARRARYGGGGDDGDAISVQALPASENSTTGEEQEEQEEERGALEDEEEFMSRFWTEGGPRGGESFAVGDAVRLSPEYEAVEDAAEGVLGWGESGRVTRVEPSSSLASRVQVNGKWWYHPRALSHRFGSATPPPRPRKLGPLARSRLGWFRAGDTVRTSEAEGVVAFWDAVHRVLHLRDSKGNIHFRAGRRLTVTRDKTSSTTTNPAPVKTSGVLGEEGTLVATPPGSFLVRRPIHQAEVIQCAPLLRPRATTCVSTLYLPAGYRNGEHMLEVFRASFADAKLGGISDNN